MKMNSNIDLLINTIIFMDGIEKGDEKYYSIDGLVIRSIHETILTKIYSLVNVGVWFFNKHTNNNIKDIEEITKYLEKKYKLSKEDKQSLSPIWYQTVNLILDCVLNNKGSFKVFGGFKSELQFQVTDKDGNYLLLSNLPIAENNPLINSKLYFSLILLDLFRFLELTLKYSCIDNYQIRNYDYSVEEFRKKNKSRNDRINYENIDGIKKVYLELFE